MAGKDTIDPPTTFIAHPMQQQCKREHPFTQMKQQRCVGVRLNPDRAIPSTSVVEKSTA
jgi:hypothetical protein